MLFALSNAALLSISAIVAIKHYSLRKSMTIVSLLQTMRARRKYRKLSHLCKYCELDTAYMDMAIYSASLKAKFCDTVCYNKHKELLTKQKEDNYEVHP